MAMTRREFLVNSLAVPVCPYLRIARWNGTGTSDDTRNFAVRGRTGYSIISPDKEVIISSKGA